MRKQFRMQMDLFITQARADLVGPERQKAVELLQALLAEAVNFARLPELLAKLGRGVSARGP
jgi:hypothetical protein